MGLNTNDRAAVLIVPPMWNLSEPPCGVAYLASVMRQAGRPISILDTSVRFLDYALAKPRLETALAIIEERFEQLANLPELSAEQKEEYDWLLGSRISGRPLLCEVSAALHTLRTISNPAAEARAKRIIDLMLRVYADQFYPCFIDFHSVVLKFSAYKKADIAEAMVSEKYNPFLNFYRNLMLEHHHLFVNASWVGFSIPFFGQLMAAFSAAHVIRELYPKAKIVFGGDTAGRIAPELARETTSLASIVDCLVPSQGESAILAIDSAIASEALPLAIPGTFCSDGSSFKLIPGQRDRVQLDQMPSPDYADFDLSTYLSPYRETPLTGSFGCEWKICTFCEYSGGETTYESRGIERLASDFEDMVHRFKAERISLTDSWFQSRKIRALARELIRRDVKVRWRCLTKAEREFDRELLLLARDSGLESLWVGFESASPKVLRLMKKGHKVEWMQTMIDNCHAIGVNVSLFLMFGFPGETEEDAELTVEFVEKNASKLASCSPGVFTLEKKCSIYQEPSRYSIDVIPSSDELSPYAEYINTDSGSFENGLARLGVYKKYMMRVSRAFANRFQELTTVLSDISPSSRLHRFPCSIVRLSHGSPEEKGRFAAVGIDKTSRVLLDDNAVALLEEFDRPTCIEELARQGVIPSISQGMHAVVPLMRAGLLISA